MNDERKVRPLRVDFPSVLNTERMKRIFVISLLTLLTSSLMAQYVGDGYYRVHNKKTNRYIYVLDNTGKINVSTTSADMGAIELHKDTTRWHHDPACIIYAHQVSNGVFDLKSQGTGVHDIIGYYVSIYQKSDGSYQVYAASNSLTVYLCDNDTSPRAEDSYLGTERTGDSRCWFVKQLNNTDQYFGILPTIQLGNKYYKPFYAAFPFSLVSSGMKVYYISAVHNNAAIISEATGTIPASTPVFIECSAPNHWSNRINIGGTASATVTSNQLRGVYFNNPDRRKSRDARTAYNPVTMRTLAVSPDGKLCFVKNTSLDYLPANESYLNVPSTAEDTLRIMTAEEYRIYTTAASITLNQSSLNLLLDETASLEATVFPTTTLNKTVQWTSSNPSVAAVNQQGVVTALTIGTATITATTTDGSNLSATCAVTVSPVIAASLTLSQTTITRVEGDTAQLTATILPANTTNKALVWTSSDTTVATVSDGIICMKKVGTASVTATTTDGSNLSATCAVTVNPVLTTGLSLSRSFISGIEGDTARLTATFVPANTTYKTLVWTSSDTAVASVTDGLVTLRKVGMATVTASTTDGTNISASCTVTSNPIPAAEIYLSQNTFTGVAGDTVTLTATVTPQNTTNKNVTWKTSNPAVATVTDGFVTIVGVGTASVTATTTDGSNLSATCTVTANPILAATITLSRESFSGIVGDTTTLVATILPANTTNKGVIWTTSNPTVATVTNGLVTLLSVGTVTVSATTKDGSALTATCSVICNPVLVSQIQLTQTSGSDPNELRINDKITLTATALPANATSKALTWESSNPAVLRILSQTNTTCQAVAGIPGESVITATALDGSETAAQFAVTVLPTLAASLSLAQDSILLSLGDSLTLPYTLLPDETTDKSVIWTSSDTTVLTVSSQGSCRAIGVGSAAVTVATLDGSNLSATCIIQVADTVIPPTLAQALNISRTSADLLLGDTLALSCTVLPLETTDKSIHWISSDTTVLTVDSTGLCRSLAVGSATIQVTTLDGSNLTAACQVTVHPILAESVSLSRTEQTLHVGDTFSLTYTLLPTNTTDPSIRLTSSDTTVVSVDSLGHCTAISLGRADIIISTLDGSDLTDTCHVSVVPILAETLTISRSAAELFLGDTLNLTYTLLPLNTTDPSIRWASSDTTVITIDSLGRCQALGLGWATVTVSTLDGSTLSDSCVIRVNPILAETLTISRTEAELHVGDTLNLTYTLLPRNTTDPSIRWTSSDTTVITIDSHGRCQANALGMAQVSIATCDGSGLMAICNILVTPILADSLALSATGMTLTIGDSASLTAQVFPATTTNPTVLWQSSAPRVVRVDNQGNIWAEGVGEAVITASTADGSLLTAQCSIVVLPILADSLAISATEMTLTIGDSASLTAQVFPATTTNPTILWQSSDPHVVRVDEQGNIWALSVGEAVISVATTDSSSLSAECTVAVEPIWVTAILLSADSLSLYENEWATLAATILPENATIRELLWQSSNEAVAIVSDDGRVTGLTAGTALIQAIAQDGSEVSATCIVEVKFFSDLLSLMATDPSAVRIYDILGRPLTKIPASGLYIINGKTTYVVK